MLFEAMQMIGDWYLIEDITYMRIYEAIQSPHLFPKHVLDRLAIRKLLTKLVFKDSTQELKKINPPLIYWNVWTHQFQLCKIIGRTNGKLYQIGKKFLGDMIPSKSCPHTLCVNLTWPYTHECEEGVKNWTYSYKEVLSTYNN